MIEGARKLPMQHISVRVPWHDAGWNGKICSNPLGNTYCIALPRIGDTRDDDWEAANAEAVFDPEGQRLPACAAERGAFMSETAYERRFPHPYARQNNALYTHFRTTTYRHAPRSASAVPFAWMMKEAKTGIPAIAERLALGFRPEREPELGFHSIWVQERSNQLVMLDTFFEAIKPKESLVFFYAKRTPLTDDPRRVIVGMGRVTGISGPTEYAYENRPDHGLRSMVWERNVSHSIRPEIGDGFLLPYQELLALAAEDADFDLTPYVLHAPEEHWDAFSMGSEHVSHDQAVSVLLSAASVISRYETLLPGEWSKARGWIDAELNRLWRLRGAFPGLGSALTALGLENGTLIAHEVGAQLHADGKEEVRDPWPLVDEVLRDPTKLLADLRKSVGPVIVQLWNKLKPERLALLKLLARFEISGEQAKRWWVHEVRKKAGLAVEDSELLANPYLCFEMDRGRTDAISWGTIDRGLFPDPQIDAAVPVPEPSACPEPIDPRRGRSLIIKTLEEATSEGHTLLPQEWIVNRIRDAEVSPACSIGSDWFEAFAENLAPVLAVAEDASGNPAWQLDRYADTRTLIGTRIRKRLSGIRHNADENWRVLIDKVIPVAAGADDAEEQAARNEKAVALEEVFRSRVSALIGPAGTGKTTLLQALLSIPAVKNGGVLLLAPTGKARVQMQKKAGDVKAFTLAQFLSEYERYDGKSFRYFMTGQPPRENGFATVIIDEASMLTEDQLAATLDALDAAAVQRLVLVGDPRQLPPIGAGRPFVDVITLLRETDAKRVPGLAELSIVRRQTGGDGVLLSRWFSGEAPDPGADEVWDRLASGHANGVRAIRWENDADLQKRLLAELTAHVRREADPSWSDETAFEVSLGGSEFKGRAYFRLSQEEGSQRVGGGVSAENWQILSPLRGGEVGVDGLNRWIKSVFRTSVRNWTDPEVFYHRKAPKPFGAQAIEYGDKVINTANGSRRFGPEKTDRAYLANGEIGLAIGQFKGRAWPKHWGLPWQLQVEFSSQAGLRFQFEKWDFGEDGDAKLELAYALTIHKSQGSEFGTTFVVIPNPCRLLSRELLYTALTRQQQEVIILYQGEIRELMRMSDAARSDTAHRLTNLFSPPSLVEHGTKFLEQGLVHRTIRGELVRSKSEVIIANLLDSMGVPYSYEQPFVGLDGSVRYPDFTVEDAESGRRLLVEHLGMLDRPDYKSRWEKKLLWYRKMGVKPVEEGQAETGLLMTSEIDGFDAAKVKIKIEAALGS